MSAVAAVDEAMNWAIHEKLLDGFFKVQKEEVLAMSLTEYDAEEVMRDIREEGREIGIAEGTQQKAVEDASNMLRKNYPVDDISEITGLPLEQVLQLQAQLKTDNN